MTTPRTVSATQNAGSWLDDSPADPITGQQNFYQVITASYCLIHTISTLIDDGEINVKKGITRREFVKTAVAGASALMIPGVALAANIRNLSGVVYINKQPAHSGSVIRAGDVVSTSHNGRISFTLGEDAYLLKERSSIKVEAGENGFINALRLFTGRFLGVFAKGGRRSIVTSTATIGIRGTACYLDSQPHETYFCTCYGTTELRTDHGTEIITATHHNAHTLSFDGVHLMTMQATTVEGHNDDELRQLEAYVGRKPPFDT